MPCIVTDGKFFLSKDKTSKQTITTNKSSAVIFETKESAANYIDNLPRTLRAIVWYTEEIEEKQKKVYFVPDQSPENSEDIKALVSSAREFYKAYQLVMERREEIRRELELADRELMDIEHAAEFFEMTKEEGYELYKTLHEIRKRRRKLKNEMAVLLAFENHNTYDNFDLRIIPELNSLEQRVYAPRVYKSMFGL